VHSGSEWSENRLRDLRVFAHFREQRSRQLREWRFIVRWVSLKRLPGLCCIREGKNPERPGPQLAENTTGVESRFQLGRNQVIFDGHQWPGAVI
jgi:hypothetical protein